MRDWLAEWVRPAHRCAPDLQTLEILLILNAATELVGVFRPAFQAECCRFDPGHPLSKTVANGFESHSAAGYLAA